jgi:hypothetical protein
MSRDVFPDPEGPTIATELAWGREKDTPRKIETSPAEPGSVR